MDVDTFSSLLYCRRLQKVTEDWSAVSVLHGLAEFFIFWVVTFKYHITLQSDETASTNAKLTCNVPFTSLWWLVFRSLSSSNISVLLGTQLWPGIRPESVLPVCSRYSEKWIKSYHIISMTFPTRLQKPTTYNWSEMHIKIMVQAQSNKRTNEHLQFPPASQIYFMTLKISHTNHTVTLSHWRSSVTLEKLWNAPFFLAAYQVCFCELSIQSSSTTQVHKTFQESKGCCGPHVAGPQDLRQSAAKMGACKWK